MLYRVCAALAFASVTAVACGDNIQATATDARTTSPDAEVPTPDATPDAMADAPIDSPPGVSFTETFAADTADVGNWELSSSGRMINPDGGDPGGYLYGEVSDHAPGWQTSSTRRQPGNNDADKRDSIFVGDYYANDIKYLSADLQVYQVGSWTRDRAVTLRLMRWDGATDSVMFDAFFSLPDLPDAPVGWNHYDFSIDARSPTVPPGWDFTRGDGTIGTDADWATFMHQIDWVVIGYFKKDTAYPGLNPWQLGIDNIHIGTQP